MRWRLSHRVVLHLLLVACLAIPGVAAPARAVAEAMAVAAATADAPMQSDMPCEEMRSNRAGESPCDCCDVRSCDLSACLGTACLPQLPRLVAHVPPAVAATPWHGPMLRTGMTGTPFRPPIT